MSSHPAFDDPDTTQAQKRIIEKLIGAGIPHENITWGTIHRETDNLITGVAVGVLHRGFESATRIENLTLTQEQGVVDDLIKTYDALKRSEAPGGLEENIRD